MTELEELNNRYSTMLQYVDLISSNDNEKPSMADIFITKALQEEQRNLNRKEV